MTATATLALAGDTMLGRGVAHVLAENPSAPLVAPEVRRYIADSDAFVLNLECCISSRGSRFPDPDKQFFFRAPPVAAERLAELGVDAVTLANNHVLDYGLDAMLDTLEHLQAAGVASVGAGTNEVLAREPKVIPCGDMRLRVIAFSDHPRVYAAAADRPGIAFADLWSGAPDWICDVVRASPDADAVLVSPHWGPNMVPAPVGTVRRAAAAIRAAGATLIAGHSAHVFHGVLPGILFDLGDFVDDYAVHAQLRNDLGLLWLVELDADGPRWIRALPLALDYCLTRTASPAETDSLVQLLRTRCDPFGTEVEKDGELIEIRPQGLDPRR